MHIDGGAIWPTARHLLCLTVSTALLSQHDAQHRAVTGHRHQPHCCLRSSEKAWQLLSLSSDMAGLTMKRKRSTCVRSLLLDAYICIRGHLTLPDRRPRFRLGFRHSGLLVLDLAWALTPHVCSTGATPTVLAGLFPQQLLHDARREPELSRSPLHDLHLPPSLQTGSSAPSGPVLDSGDSEVAWRNPAGPSYGLPRCPCWLPLLITSARRCRRKT